MDSRTKLLQHQTLITSSKSASSILEKDELSTVIQAETTIKACVHQIFEVDVDANRLLPTGNCIFL